MRAPITAAASAAVSVRLPANAAGPRLLSVHNLWTYGALMRDAREQHRYLVSDRWTSREAYEAFKQEHDGPYRALHWFALQPGED